MDIDWLMDQRQMIQTGSGKVQPLCQTQVGFGTIPESIVGI